MNTKSIARRNFIKRTAVTAVAAAFALSVFQSSAVMKDADGSCICKRFSLRTDGQVKVMEVLGPHPPLENPPEHLVIPLTDPPTFVPPPKPIINTMAYVLPPAATTSTVSNIRCTDLEGAPMSTHAPSTGGTWTKGQSITHPGNAQYPNGWVETIWTFVWNTYGTGYLVVC